MRALLLRGPRAMFSGPAALEAASVATPEPAPGEVVVRVSVCGVCRTDLDVVEGRIAAPRYPVIPGHQVIGQVAARGETASGLRDGERVGIAWIHSACGTCRWCVAGTENLCPEFRSTGCDVHGGYAEYVTVPASFAHPIPDALGDAEAAPLLCAGAIGVRSLRLAKLHDGDMLGLTGFGASAHLVLQFARQRYPSTPVFVFARNAAERQFAAELGAAWTGDTIDEPPARLAAIIDTTPAWKPVVDALPNLEPGGRLVINAIRKTSADQHELLRVNYASHLWMERELKSVANVTRADVREALAAAATMGLRPTVTELPLERGAEALASLAAGAAVRGATVLRVA
jgi:alcohol dehydrogenase, propanol-preferring